MEEGFQSVGQDLGNDFVNYITKTDGFELMSKIRTTNLRNKG